MIDLILSSPFFGLFLTCAAWELGKWVQARTRILLLLVGLHIPYAAYETGGSLISMLLGPVTAVLALNIDHQRKLLRE